MLFSPVALLSNNWRSVAEMEGMKVDALSPQPHQLKYDGTCYSCNALARETEFLQCRICQLMFHAVCPESDSDE